MAKQMTEEERAEITERTRVLDEESAHLTADLALKQQEKDAKEKNSQLKKDIDDFEPPAEGEG